MTTFKRFTMIPDTFKYISNFLGVPFSTGVLPEGHEHASDTFICLSFSLSV